MTQSFCVSVLPDQTQLTKSFALHNIHIDLWHYQFIQNIHLAYSTLGYLPSGRIIISWLISKKAIASSMDIPLRFSGLTLGKICVIAGLPKPFGCQ